MSRKENEEWLRREAEREPDGWAARYARRYGWAGLLDMYDAADGHPESVNLSHRPFAGNDELKWLVRNAREAKFLLARAIYERQWADDAAEKAASTPEEKQ